MSTLKYPEGDFTQAELATFNGMEKIDVYLPLRDAIANGTVAKVGTRPTGKRPANVFRLSTAAAAIPAAVEAPQSAPVDAPVAVVAEVPPPSAPVALAVEPIIEPVTIPVVSIRPATKSDPNPSLPCPLCSGPMVVVSDDSGTTVRCENVCVPSCHENVFGHGKDVKEALSVAGQKFKPRA